MSQPSTFGSFCQLLNATDISDFESEAERMEDLEDLGTQPSNKSTEPGPAGNSNRRKRKRIPYSKQQLASLQAFFEKNHRPSRRQREDLGRSLGLTPLRVRLWFETSRKKWRFERTKHDNTFLRAENERLRAENARYREILYTQYPEYGNKAALEEDMNEIFAITKEYVKEPAASNYSHLPSSSHSPYPLQTQLDPIEPTLMPSEKGDMCNLEWSYADDELVVMLSQFNAEAPKL